MTLPTSLQIEKANSKSINVEHGLWLTWWKSRSAPVWDEAWAWALHKEQGWGNTSWGTGIPAVKSPLGSNIESFGENGSVALVCGIPVPLGSDGAEPLGASFGRGREVSRLDGHWGGMAALSPGSNTRPPLPASCSWVHAWVSAFSTWEKGGGKGAISSVRFWAHEQLTHVIHSFDVLGLFVEAEDHSSALDKLIVSIKDLNECHMQMLGNKAGLQSGLQSRLHPPGTPWVLGAVEVLQGSPAMGDNSLFSSAHPSALKTVHTFKKLRSAGLIF